VIAGALSESAEGAPTPYVSFWIPSRIVGALFCVVGLMVLFVAMRAATSVGVVLSGYSGSSGLSSYGLSNRLLDCFMLWGAILLSMGIPLLAGIMKSTTGRVLFVLGILLLLSFNAPYSWSVISQYLRR
jgi:hypothetical protein